VRRAHHFNHPSHGAALSHVVTMIARKKNTRMSPFSRERRRQRQRRIAKNTDRIHEPSSVARSDAQSAVVLVRISIGINADFALFLHTRNRLKKP